MDMLTKIQIQGFKSILQLEELCLQPLNILIGANGAGKSNFIRFFSMLNWMTPSPGNLQFFIAKAGGANTLLFDGAAKTSHIQAHLTFQTNSGINEYQMRLFYAAPDTLIFAEESFRFSRNDLPTSAHWNQLGAGHKESHLIEAAAQGNKTAWVILSLMKQCVVYQFHNTSETSRIKTRWNINDSRMLKEDGANLAPLLYRLSETEPRYYQRIVQTIRQITPFFSDFVLDPINNTLLLQWREEGSDVIFDAHQASDGMLRTIALITLLLQPEKDLPSVIILDEPELGLHPYAINILAGIIKGISLHSQIILSTQSMTLIDYFSPEDIIVVDRVDRESRFRRLDPAKLEEWLEEYSLGELWEKNVIGGRPS